MPSKKKSSGAKTRTMSADHKAAISAGRAQNQAVRTYLEALEATKPKRGRRRTPESIQKRIATIEAQLVDADPIARLNLLQEQVDLDAELAQMAEVPDISGAEADFVTHAAAYSARKGISYGVWRKMGVQPGVLKAAGIGRGR